MHQETNVHVFPSPQWKRPAVLLIDANAARQLGRAAGMRGRGVMVDCADNGATAYTLWAPEAYQLVLVDFGGADDAVGGFCRHVQELSPLQKMGFYRAAPPYIVRSQAAAGERPRKEPLRLPRERLQDALAEAEQRGSGHWNLREAAQRIAALRLRPKASATESHASIAARVLSGDQ